MTERVIAGLKPTVMKLEQGKTYWWCRCGRSQNQPFCDGAHAGTDIEPMEFTATSDKNVALCTCKATAGEPFCDGNHKRLNDA